MAFTDSSDRIILSHIPKGRVVDVRVQLVTGLFSDVNTSRLMSRDRFREAPALVGGG